jgi:hypothetical protein
MAGGNKHLITLINKNINMTQSQLNKLTLLELSKLNRMVVDTIKAKKKTDSKEKRKAFSIGDKVIVEHKKTSGKVFIIKDIRLTKATVHEVDGFGRYDVPLTMIGPYCY